MPRGPVAAAVILFVMDGCFNLGAIKKEILSRALLQMRPRLHLFEYEVIARKKEEPMQKSSMRIFPKRCWALNLETDNRDASKQNPPSS